LLYIRHDIMLNVKPLSSFIGSFLPMLLVQNFAVIGDHSLLL